MARLTTIDAACVDICVRRFSNITSITKPSGVENYGYDALDRLNAYTLPSQAQVTYGYDFDGNRLSETQSGVTVNHTYATTSNRQLTAAGAMIGYDANGNRSSDSGGTRTFSYDVRNRLRQAIASGQTVATYTINALGERVRKVAGSSDIDAVYDLTGKLIGEYANGAQIREYVYLDDVPVAQIAANGVITYLHPDHLGTPRSATNSNAQIVWRWDSDPFGKTTPNQDPDGDSTLVTVNLRFPGQYFDMETGLNYNYFRDYDAGVGRYVQSDPIGLAGGLNSYGYVGQNPLSYSDPTGLRPWDLNGRGDTAVCAYYDKRVDETCGTLHDYYVAAGQICRATRPDVNLLMDVGIAASWASGTTDKSQADIYDQVRGGLMSRDTALVRQHGAGELTGNMIDFYHDQVFQGAGISPVFYGGNLWPQGVWPNPVPFDSDRKSPVDPRHFLPQGSSSDCECKAR